jgi:phosphomannomutase
MEAESHQLTEGGRVRLVNVLKPYTDRIVGDVKLAAR